MNRIVSKKGSYTYALTESVISYEDFGTTVVFGISMYDKTRVYEAEDISPDYCFVQELFDLIVGLGLHPEHFYDVIEDYLTDHSPKVVTIKMPLNYPFIA